MENTQVVPAEAVQSSVGGGVFLGSRELLRRSWEIFKAKWRTLLLISLLPLALIILFAIVVAILAIAGGAGIAAFSQGGNLFESMSVGTMIALFVLAFVVYILIVIVALWSQIASLTVISRSEEKIGVAEAYRLSKSRLGAYFFTSLVVGIFVFAGYMAFIVPGIILAIWFAFSGYVALVENKSGLTAALVSRGYVRGRAWEVFKRFAFVFALYILAMIVLGVVDDIVNPDPNNASVIVSLISNIVSYIFTTVITIYSYLMYKNLRELHGGEVVVADSTKRKYSILAVVGLLVSVVIIIALVASMIAFAVNFQKNYGDKNMFKMEENVLQDSERMMQEDGFDQFDENYYNQNDPVVPQEEVDNQESI